jgi:DNA-binding CsgD family transcriptional regulator
VFEAPGIDAEIALLAELAARCTSRQQFRSESLRRLQPMIGFDSAVFCSRSAEKPASVNAPTSHTASLVTNFETYVEDLRPVERAANAAGGVAVDLQVFSPRQRQRLRFYREIVEPQGIRSLLAIYLKLGAREAGVIYCARQHRTRFDERTCTVARALVPVLALGDGVHPSGDARDDVQFGTTRPDWSRLSRRERELLEYVALGLRNQDIATALSVSPHTVRNQLSAVYEKLGVANRTELARFAVTSGLVRR